MVCHKTVRLLHRSIKKKERDCRTKLQVSFMLQHISTQHIYGNDPNTTQLRENCDTIQVNLLYNQQTSADLPQYVRETSNPGDLIETLCAYFEPYGC